MKIVTREQTEKVLSLVWQAALNVDAPNIGNRQELEEDLLAGDEESSKIVLFFLEYGRLFSATVAPTGSEFGGQVLIDSKELSELRDKAAVYEGLQ